MKNTWLTEQFMNDVTDISSQYDQPLNYQTIRYLRELPNCCPTVVLENDTTLGFMIYTLETTFLRIAHIAVRTPRQHVGSFMIHKLFKQLDNMPKRSEIRVSVPERNLPALLFFRHLGFRSTNLRHNQFGRNVDGIDMNFLKHSCSLHEILEIA